MSREKQAPDTRVWKQEWRCDHCRYRGWVWFGKEDDAISTKTTAVEQHSTISEECYLKHEGRGIRMIGEPELVPWG